MKENIENETISKTVVTVYKSSLNRALNLQGAQAHSFYSFIGEEVRVVSMRMRRASIALLYHLTKMASEGMKIPNLYDMKSTFWKHLLELHPNRMPAELNPGLSDTIKIIERFIGTPVELNRSESINGCVNDQILAYAAETLSTIVCNNAWVPLIPRLTRLVKQTIRGKKEESGCKVDTHSVMKAITSANLDLVCNMPSWVSLFVNEVRDRLLLNNDQRLYDNYGKNINFHDMFMFNYWMQQRFNEMKVKGIKLSPVCKVGRFHCRLDRKVLLEFLKKHCSNRQTVVKMLELDKVHSGLSTSNPCRLLPPKPIFGDKKKAEQKRVNLVLNCANIDDPKISFKIMKRPDKNGNLKTKLTVSKDPKKPDNPLKVKFQLVDIEEDPEEKSRRERILDEWEKTIDSIKSSEEYISQKARYDCRKEAETFAIKSLFKDRMASKNGWQFDGSVVTDGVAVSLLRCGEAATHASREALTRTIFKKDCSCR